MGINSNELRGSTDKGEFMCGLLEKTGKDSLSGLTGRLGLPIELEHLVTNAGVKELAEKLAKREGQLFGQSPRYTVMAVQMVASGQLG